MAQVTPNSCPGKSPPCQLCTLPLSPDPKPPSLLLPSTPIAALSRLACLRSLAAWGGVGRGTKERVFFSPALPLPWAPGAEGFLVSSLEQGTKPSPAWPHSGHSWERVSLETGWLGGACAISMCLCNWSVFMYLRMCLCLWACVSLCLCLSLCLWIRVFKLGAGVNSGLMVTKSVCAPVRI